MTQNDNANAKSNGGKIRFWDRAIAVAKSFSLRPVVFSTSCCSFDIDMALTSSFKLDKIGLSDPSSDFTKADLYIVAGCMNKKFIKVIEESYYSSSIPKYVIAVGECATSGDVFKVNGESKRLEDIIPVDLKIPGCPPSSDEIVNGLKQLKSRIRGGYLRKNLSDHEVREYSYDIPSVIKHGFSMNMLASGNRIEELSLETGFSYRGLEEVIKGKGVSDILSYLEKIDYISPVAGSILLVKNIESGLAIEAPERRDYIEGIILEFMRIRSHLRNFSHLVKYFGNSSLYTHILVYEERLSGLLTRFDSSSVKSYFTPGGTISELDNSLISDLKSFVDSFTFILKLLEKKIFGNTLIMSQLDCLGRIRKKHALDFSLSGPNLRATGINMDSRKESEFYKKFNFKPVLGRYGDAKDRFYVRLEEMRQSASFIKKFIEKMPEGSTKIELNKNCILEDITISPHHHCIEVGRGELGLSLTIDSGKISEIKINDPSYYVVDMINKSYCDIDLDSVELNLLSFDIDVGGVDK